MNGALLYLFLGAITVLAIVLQITHDGRRERTARTLARQSGGATAIAQHPRIDLTYCIGCGSCVEACPESNVLAVIGGKAALAQPQKCIGHGLCAEACPVGAIQIVTAPPSVNADVPVLTAELETEIPGLFVVGELGGLALIKNAVNQGRDCVDRIAARVRHNRQKRMGEVVDVCVVGAGPAGLSAGLRAVERGLSYVVLEAEDLGGTVAKYPRQKLVLTSPVEFPTQGPFRKLELSKEELLEFWTKAVRKAGLKVRTRERVEMIQREPDGAFTVETAAGRYRALTVVLAIGRRGTPRKLDIPGEELPKVMYSLVDASSYKGKRILVVGGGDSAVEAAMGLAHQSGNVVTISYRKDVFSRLKDRNDKRIREYMRKGRVQVLFNSQPLEIRPGSVLLSVPGGQRELPNDLVWVFAGGTPPNAFMERIGLALGSREVEGGREVA